MGRKDRIIRNLLKEKEALSPEQETTEQTELLIDWKISQNLKKRRKRWWDKFWVLLRNTGSIAGLVLIVIKACSYT